MELADKLLVGVLIILFVQVVLLSMIGNVLDKIHYVLKEIMHKLGSKNE
ncbi:hypothetical protein ES702_04407 [subsurface metagenome]